MFLLTANCYVGRNSVEVDCCFYSFATPLTPRSSGDTRAATTIRWWKRWSRTRRIKWRRFRRKQLKSREAMIDGVKLMVSVSTLGDGRRVALVGRSNSCRWQRIRWRIGWCQWLRWIINWHFLLWKIWLLLSVSFSLFAQNWLCRAKIQHYYLLTWMLMAELCRSRSRPPLAPIIKELHHVVALAVTIKKATLSSDLEEGLIVATTFFFWWGWGVLLDSWNGNYEILVWRI